MAYFLNANVKLKNKRLSRVMVPKKTEIRLKPTEDLKSSKIIKRINNIYIMPNFSPKQTVKNLSFPLSASGTTKISH